MTSSDLLFDDDEEAPDRSHASIDAWTVLIVDDDREVHAATTLALSDVVCLGRPLKFLNAYSAAQAREILRTPQDIAVILLDVVMETDDAGLQLVRYIRDVLDMQAVRIILRTGQPGLAPERDIIVQYDINDYKSKTELTETRLFTALVVALRGYRHLVSLETSRLGLHKVIDAASSLHRSQSLERFADGVLMQLSAILNSNVHSILCTHRRAETEAGMMVVARSGRFRDFAAGQEDLSQGGDVHDYVRQALETRKNVLGDSRAAIYLRTPTGGEVVVYVECGRALNELDLSLLEMFGQSISIGYDNLEIYGRMQDNNATLEQRVVERTLALTESETYLKQFKAAVEHSSSAILIMNRKGIVQYVNPAMTRSSECSEAEMLGKHVTLFDRSSSPDVDYKTPSDQLLSGKSWRGELQTRRKNGEKVWNAVTVSPVTDSLGAVTHFILIAEDISETKKLEDELRHLATTDPLTGLLNRRSFLSLAEQQVARLKRYPGSLSVAMLDVDHFKSINDRYGHQAGDEVLRELSAFCNGCMREQDFMGRLGGEEFAFVMPETSLEQAMLVADRLRAEVSSRKIRLPGGNEVTVTVSVGTAAFKEPENGIDAVLHRADQALYRAKQDGRNCIRSTA
jgi:diguanylate cyclase (GGDEF)-like protein/PAS domain S-box-containing protein